MQRFSPKAFSVLEKKIFKGSYYIWAWRPSWSTDRDHFSNFSFPHPKEASYEILAKLAQRLQRRSRLKMIRDGRTDGRRTKSDHNSSSWAELRWAKNIRKTLRLALPSLSEVIAMLKWLKNTRTNNIRQDFKQILLKCLIWNVSCNEASIEQVGVINFLLTLFHIQ